MTRRWLTIAKAEFKVQTSSHRKKRIQIMGFSMLLGIFWALVIAPTAMQYVLSNVLNIPVQVLVALMPRALRAGMMLIWFILVLLPLSNALKEVKGGQWEILLSSNASTRDIFVGSYIGRLPINGLIVLYLAPILISPFVGALRVTLIGLAFMYGVIALISLSTIWFANLIVTYVQAKLGGSERGKDVAKALALVLGMVTVMPLIGFQLFASEMFDLFGLDIFLLFPFTWGADTITAAAVLFTGIDSRSLPATASLGFDIATNIILMAGYVLILVVGTLASVNRLISLSLGVRVQSATRSHGDSMIYRGIRRLAPGAFGVVLITVVKDFSRKAQNIMQLGLTVGMAVFMPIIVGFVSSHESTIDFMMILVTMSLAFALLGGRAFGAIGFLESRDQLWVLQSVPRGTSVYAMARLVQACLLLIPCAALPAILMAFFVQLTLTEMLLLFTIPLGTGIGSALVAIGVTASNPLYEDANSSGLKANVSKFMVITLLSFLFYTIVDLVLGLVFGLGDVTRVIYGIPWLYMLAMFSPLPIVGLAVFLRGMRVFGRLE